MSQNQEEKEKEREIEREKTITEKKIYENQEEHRGQKKGNWRESFIIAFSMYSRIPMPRTEWTEAGMQYALCFFPAIGIVIGAVVCVFMWIAQQVRLGEIAVCCIGTAIPLLITGGIHMDGFLDTTDAHSSFADREKKLEILKDPNTGAFAVIGYGVYLLLYLSAWSELKIVAFPAVGAIYVMTRALSGWSVVGFPKARKNGLASTFAMGARDRTVKQTMIQWWILAMAFLVYFAGWLPAVLMAGAELLVFRHYYRMAVHEFGGMTGDLAGHFLQSAELVMYLVVAGYGLLVW